MKNRAFIRSFAQAGKARTGFGEQEESGKVCFFVYEEEVRGFCCKPTSVP